MFMPSLNNYNTRSQMALNAPLCRTIKGRKSMSFLGSKIWNKSSSNIRPSGLDNYFVWPIGLGNYFIWPSGLGNYFVCKGFAVQTLLWSKEFVIQTSLKS